MLKPYSELRVMVVDDSRSIRELLSAILQELGVGRVIEAQEGAEALRLLDAEPGGIDMLFCDLAMPGMDGVQTLRALGERRMHSPIALLSGLDARLLRSVGDMALQLGLNLAGLMGKPFDLYTVKSLLDQAVDTRLARAQPEQALMEPAEIDRAMDEGRLYVRYQPKIGLASGRVTGVEALARIRDPHRGMVGPTYFVPVAEQDAARISRLTVLVLQQALAQTAAWRAKGLSLDLAVNFSTVGIDRLDLPELLAKETAQVGLEHHLLTVEITETRAINSAAVLDTVARLRLQDFRLSIDDFGTGDSGLQRLCTLPFTELKIDRSFVHNASRQAHARAVLQSSIELARRLDLEVVAEGVEQMSDWRLLERLGCGKAQGFLAAKPMPGELMFGFSNAWNLAAA